MFWIIALGIATGARTMTPLAVLCWFAWLGHLQVADTPIAWTGKLVALIVFTAFALGEYVGDTLPSTPSRKKLPLMLARLAMAIFVGCLVATLLGQPLAGGAVFGGIGALIGTYGGYAVRVRGARLFGRDLPMALLESACALGLAILAMDHVRQELASFVRHASL